MLRYETTDLRELAHQLTMSPRRLRLKQLDGVEELLSIIELERSYPYDLVCYTITGYNPKGKQERAAIPAEKLVPDLVTLADQISRKAKLTTEEIPDECQTHEELAEQLNVSTKTIRRWRKRGLVGVRVICEDGVARTLFRSCTVKRFVEQNEDLVKRGSSFQQLTEQEKDEIVASARRILEEKRIKMHLVARQIAAQTGRAVETIRYTLRQYDQSHPDDALFANDGQPLVSRRLKVVWEAHQAGDSPEKIARALSIPPEQVEQHLREYQARLLKEAQIEYVPNELFDAPNADALILDVPEPETAQRHRKPRVPNDLPAYLRSLYEIPLLSAEQERDAFRRYNYLKYKTSRRVAALNPSRVSQDELDEIAELQAAVEEIKQRLIQSNLRLVVSIAKRHVGGSDNFFEIVSDGNLSLMRAIEKFDYARGNKFSTYATWAVSKNFARTIPEEHYYCRQFVTGQEELLGNAGDYRAPLADDTDLEGIRDVLAAGMSELTEREREVVTGHYGLFGSGQSQTLEQLGQRLGVTKERVRQIEKRAISKIRQALSPQVADLMTE